MGFFDNLKVETYVPIGGAEMAHREDPRAFTGAALLAQATFYCEPAKQREIEQAYARGGMAALEVAGQAMYAELQRRHRKSYDACDRMVEQETVLKTTNEKLADAIVGNKWGLRRLQSDAVKARQELVKRNQPRLKLRPAAIAEEKMVDWIDERRKSYAANSKSWDQTYAENLWVVRREWKKYRDAEAKRIEAEGKAAKEEQTAAGLILPKLDERIIESGKLSKQDRKKLADEFLDQSEHFRHGLVHMVFEPAAPKLKRQNLALAGPSA